MKTKIFIFSILMLLSSMVYAQTEKGTFLISGKSSLEFVKNNTNLTYSSAGRGFDHRGSTHVNSFVLSPAIAYFVANNFAVGLSSTYSYTDTRADIQNIENQTNSLILMPTLMYYIPLKSKFRPYVQIGGGFAGQTIKESGQRQSFTGFALGGGAGLAYFINKNLSIDLGLELVDSEVSYSEDTNLKLSTGNLGTVIGFSIFL